jgi:hypothetical protein
MWQSSLQSAFASLDAASRSGSSVEGAVNQQPSSTGEARRAKASFVAQPLGDQRAWDGAGRYPLSAGPSLDEMRREAHDRHQRKERLRTVEAAGHEPSYQDNRLLSLQIDDVTDVPPPAGSTPSPVSNAQLPLVSPRKRTLAWAAKRDRRNARRRLSPPLTRRRAALKEREISATPTSTLSVVSTTPAVRQGKAPRLRSSSPPPPLRIERPGERSEMTDPSSTSASNVTNAIEQPASRRPAKRAKKPMAVLDMTVSDAFEPQTLVVSSLCTQPSSQTQSESGEQHLHNPLFVDESETEDEEISGTTAFAPSPTPAAPTRRRQVPRKRPATLSSARPRSKKSTTKSVKKVIPQRVARTTTGNAPQGRSLFTGLTFIVIGFWSKVKLYEMLIAKHDGQVIKSGTASDEDMQRVSHVICCPHADFRPDTNAVRRAMAQWCNDEPERCAGLTKRCTQGHALLVDVRWISDCIEVSIEIYCKVKPSSIIRTYLVFTQKCATKDELRPIDDYRLRL